MRRIDWAPAGVFVALGIGIIARSLSNPSEVMNFGKRLGSIFDFGSGSGQTRVEIWRAAIAAIKERPILGWGADTFRLAFTKHKTAEYVQIMGGSSGADNAHDYPLQLASGDRYPRRAPVLRHLRLGRGEVLRDRVPAFERSCAHHPGCVLGRLGRLSRPSLLRPLGHRRRRSSCGSRWRSCLYRPLGLSK